MGGKPAASAWTAQEWDERYAASAPWGAEPNVWVRLHTEGLAPARALDLACGDGRHALWLAARGWQVHATDFSAAAVARGRAAEAAARAALQVGAADPAPTPTPIVWQVADLTATAPTGDVDLVVIAYLHLPAPDRDHVLTGAAQAVAPGGTLVLVAHDLTNLAEGVGGPQDASVLTEPHGVARTLEAAGLEVVVAEVARRPVPQADRPALDTVVVARRPASSTRTKE